MFGSSLALAISNIPFNGPIAGVQVGYVNGELIINPDQAQQEASLLELTVAGNKDAINMVESGAKELSEEVMLEALLKVMRPFKNSWISKIKSWQQLVRKKQMWSFFKWTRNCRLRLLRLTMTIGAG